MHEPLRVFIGFDAEQMVAWNVAAFSLRARAQAEVHVQRVSMSQLQAKQLYTRPTGMLEHGYWDEISQAPMSTGHAIARFLVPYLCGYEGWCVFMDGDVLLRADICELFALADPTKAIQVVQHAHDPKEAVKMTGESQTRYARKNWSSVILWHAGHPANKTLTVDLVNTVPGRDLHRFCWLSDDLIGALPPQWNVLVGEDDVPDPALVHFTLGLPSMPGYEYCDYANEWFATARSAGYRLSRPPKPAEAVA